jgi:hypothetical protein
LKIYVSDKLTDSEYAAGQALNTIASHEKLTYLRNLHLSVSMRSFRAENLSQLVKNILDIDLKSAVSNYESLYTNYPIVLLVI